MHWTLFRRFFSSFFLQNSKFNFHRVSINSKCFHHTANIINIQCYCSTIFLFLNFFYTLFFAVCRCRRRSILRKFRQLQCMRKKKIIGKTPHKAFSYFGMSKWKTKIKKWKQKLKQKNTFWKIYALATEVIRMEKNNLLLFFISLFSIREWEKKNDYDLDKSCVYVFSECEELLRKNGYNSYSFTNTIKHFT